MQKQGRDGFIQSLVAVSEAWNALSKVGDSSLSRAAFRGLGAQPSVVTIGSQRGTADFKAVSSLSVGQSIALKLWQVEMRTVQAAGVTRPVNGRVVLNYTGPAQWSSVNSSMRWTPAQLIATRFAVIRLYFNMLLALEPMRFYCQQLSRDVSFYVQRMDLSDTGIVSRGEPPLTALNPLMKRELAITNMSPVWMSAELAIGKYDGNIRVQNVITHCLLEYFKALRGSAEMAGYQTENLLIERYFGSNWRRITLGRRPIETIIKTVRATFLFCDQQSLLRYLTSSGPVPAFRDSVSLRLNAPTIYNMALAGGSQLVLHVR